MAVSQSRTARPPSGRRRCMVVNDDGTMVQVAMSRPHHNYKTLRVVAGALATSTGSNAVSAAFSSITPDRLRVSFSDSAVAQCQRTRYTRSQMPAGMMFLFSGSTVPQARSVTDRRPQRDTLVRTIHSHRRRPMARQMVRQPSTCRPPWTGRRSGRHGRLSVPTG